MAKKWQKHISLHLTWKKRLSFALDGFSSLIPRLLGFFFIHSLLCNKSYLLPSSQLSGLKNHYLLWFCGILNPNERFLCSILCSMRLQSSGVLVWNVQTSSLTWLGSQCCSWVGSVLELLIKALLFLPHCVSVWLRHPRVWGLGLKRERWKSEPLKRKEAKAANTLKSWYPLIPRLSL